MKTLLDLKKNQKATIKKVNSTGEIKKRLMEMGALPGSEVSILKIAPLGDPLEILIKGYKLSIRKSEAKEIIIEEETL